jgi:hypothetical protein
VLLDLATARRELWKELGPKDVSGVRSINRVSITPDGSAYAYSFGRQLGDLYVVEGLR